MIAILCPGQGSQKPGLLTPWLELDGAAEHLQRLSDAASLDLAHYGTAADEQTIKDTAIAQPLIVAAGLLAARRLGIDFSARQDVIFAGHSVGEITASALAGALSEEDAMAFVAARANGMAEAAAAQPTGMAAVLSPKTDEVLAALEEIGATPANMNGAGQIVAAGTREQIAQLAENPPARARVIPLKVAGAFHTQHMAPAVAGLREVASGITPAQPHSPLLSNADGRAVADGQANLQALIDQVCSPVRWDLCMESLTQHGVDRLIELCPAGTLVGLAKRGMKSATGLALDTPEQLDQARAVFSS